jgi:hypothetical protein
LRIYSNVGNPRIGSETEDSLNRSSNIASKIWLIIAELSNIWPILALRKKKVLVHHDDRHMTGSGTEVLQGECQAQV